MIFRYLGYPWLDHVMYVISMGLRPSYGLYRSGVSCFHVHVHCFMVVLMSY